MGGWREEGEGGGREGEGGGRREEGGGRRGRDEGRVGVREGLSHHGVRGRRERVGEREEGG